MSDGTAVRPFEFDGSKIRVVMIDGEPWFVAADVCKVLDIGNPSQAVTRLDEADEYQQVAGNLISNEVGFAPRGVLVVSESGLYVLVLGSRKPEARKFKRWVTGEVLPTIRKTGAYGVQRELTRRELLVMALEAEDRADLWENRARQERAAVEAAAPKVEAFDQLIDAEGLYSLANVAQVLHMGRDKLIAELARLKLIIVRPGHSDHLRPYQAQVQAGRFVVKVRVFDVVKDGQSETRTEGTTKVTPKGLTHIRALLAQGKAPGVDPDGQARIA